MATTRTFPAAHLDIGLLANDLHTWFLGQSFNCQTLTTEQGGTLLQIEKQGGWRKFAGMSTALNVVLKHTGRELIVEIGAGKWLDKAAAGAVSLFVLWPLAVTAAYGAWEQGNMPGRVFEFISKWVLSHQVQSRPSPPSPLGTRRSTSPLVGEPPARLRPIRSSKACAGATYQLPPWFALSAAKRGCRRGPAPTSPACCLRRLRRRRPHRRRCRPCQASIDRQSAGAVLAAPRRHA